MKFHNVWKDITCEKRCHKFGVFSHTFGRNAQATSSFYCRSHSYMFEKPVKHSKCHPASCGIYFQPALLSSRQICSAASPREEQRGGAGTICGGPTLAVQATCWKPRGGAHPDSRVLSSAPLSSCPSSLPGPVLLQEHRQEF